MPGADDESDEEAAIAALVGAGAIDELEARLDRTSANERAGRERAALLASMGDLDVIGERLAALSAGRAFVARFSDDEVAAKIEDIARRLSRPPRLRLSLDGVETRIVLGEE